MSKIKKIFATLLALAMVLGMSTTAFAASTGGTITIQNAGEGTFQYLQVIKADNTKETGWDFVNDDIAKNYTDGFNDNNSQNVIKKLIADEEGTGTYTAEIAAALANVQNAGYKLTTATLDANGSFAVSAPGLYYVMGNETGYKYSPMAAYISFDNTVNNAVLNAKKAPDWVTKDADAEQKVTEIGHKVTYDVKSTVPFITLENTNKTYVFNDTLTGAAYNVNDEGKLPVKVTVGDGAETTYYATVDGNSFTLDLSVLVQNNDNANKTIKLSYDVTVTDVQVGNTVIVGNSVNNPNDNYGSDGEKLYTGEISLIKYGDEAKTKVLENAEFKIYKIVDGNQVFANFTNTDGVKSVAWGDETAATTFKTNTEGKIKAEGLNLGTYYFKETKAPDGYSVNTNDAEIKITQDGDATEVIVATPATMIDTTLKALPGTGGIGTTIFTVGGCLIMIAAAALFFASRKKHTK